MKRFLQLTRAFIYLPVAIIGFFAPGNIANADANATSDSLPFTPANNGCGPYQALTVTGTTGGAIWGSNPYTDDSTFSSAAVHAGLIAVGETAIIEPYLVDNYSNYQGSAANGVSTYNWGGGWCGYYIRILGTGEETPATTLPPYLNSVTGLTAVANENGSVDLDWDAPTSSNVDIYAYSVSFYDLDEIGGTTSGGWGVWTNQGTIYLLAEYMFSGSNPVTTGYGPVRFGVKAGNQSCFSNEGVGPCVYGPETTVDATVLDPNPSTTTTTEPETTTTEPEPEPTTTTEVVTVPPETTTTVDIPEIPSITTTTEVIEVIEVTTTTEPEPEPNSIIEAPSTTEGEDIDAGESGPPATEASEVEVSEPPAEEETATTEPLPVVEPENPQETVDNILSEDLSPAELTEAIDDALAGAESEDELVAIAGELLAADLDADQFAAVVEQVFSQDLSDEALTELVAEVFSQDLSDEELAAVVDQVFDGEISDEAFAEVLNTVFEEELSDEAFDSVIDAILDEPISDAAFDELVDVLGSDTVSDEQVQSAVTSIIDNGITESQAVSIATSGEVLQSITGDQATDIFATVPITEITDDEAIALVGAVQDAPVEVKEAFEEEINIFTAGNIDIYVPLGSSVPVNTRRLIIAATAIIFVMPIPSPTATRKI